MAHHLWPVCVDFRCLSVNYISVGLCGPMCIVASACVPAVCHCIPHSNSTHAGPDPL